MARYGGDVLGNRFAHALAPLNYNYTVDSWRDPYQYQYDYTATNTGPYGSRYDMNNAWNTYNGYYPGYGGGGYRARRGYGYGYGYGYGHGRRGIYDDAHISSPYDYYDAGVGRDAYYHRRSSDHARQYDRRRRSFHVGLGLNYNSDSRSTRGCTRRAGRYGRRSARMPWYVRPAYQHASDWDDEYGYARGGRRALRYQQPLYADNWDDDDAWEDYDDYDDGMDSVGYWDGGEGLDRRLGRGFERFDEGAGLYGERWW